jgi:hypothetical protein
MREQPLNASSLFAHKWNEQRSSGGLPISLKHTQHHDMMTLQFTVCLLNTLENFCLFPSQICNVFCFINTNYYSF